MAERVLTNMQINRDLVSGAKFLQGVGTVIPVRLTLIDAGYTKSEHEYGWEKYFFLMGYQWEIPENYTTDPVQPYARFERWSKINFRLAKIALKRLHPVQHDYLFSTSPKLTGVAAMAAVYNFLDKIRKLREGRGVDSEAQLAEDQAAVKTLEKRNIISPEIESELWDLIAEATKLNSTPEEVLDIRETDEYQQKAVEFHEWLKDWRMTARTVIKRRDYLIRLGLVKKRKSKKAKNK